MTTTFNGQPLFNSSPHRFRLQRTGRLALPPLAGANLDLIWADYEQLELVLEQTGRLTAPTAADLWTQADAIRTLAEAPTTATLIDPDGRTWPNLTLLLFEPLGPIDRGRVYSLPYRALYVQRA